MLNIFLNQPLFCPEPSQNKFIIKETAQTILTKFTTRIFSLRFSTIFYKHITLTHVPFTCFYIQECNIYSFLQTYSSSVQPTHLILARFASKMYV